MDDERVRELVGIVRVKIAIRFEAYQITKVEKIAEAHRLKVHEEKSWGALDPSLAKIALKLAVH